MQLFTFHTNQEKLVKLLSSDRSGLKDVYNKLIERNFYIGEAEIPRKTLNGWQNAGLIPFTHKETGWTQFSLVEYVWLRCINELRIIGLSLEKIKKIKEFFFRHDLEEYKELFLEALRTFTGDVQDKENVIEVFKRKDIPEKIWIEAMEELQISPFTMLILEVLVNNHNLCFTIDIEDRIQVIVLGKVVDDRVKKNEAATSQLTDCSFALVNLKKIVQGFFSSEKIGHDNDYLLAFLNKKEKAIVEKIREGGVKEIKISFSNNKPVLLKLTKDVKPDEAINKVSRILKKGEFSDISLKTRDGKLLNYEQTDLFRLK